MVLVLSKAEGLGRGSTPKALYGIAARPRMASSDSLYFSVFGLDSIPSATDSIKGAAYPVFEGKGCYTEKGVCRKQKGATPQMKRYSSLFFFIPL